MATNWIYALSFYAAAAVAVASAFLVIWHKHPVICALNLVVCFFAVAVIYVLLQAHFLAAVQVLLYAGAVLVLFLMIIMLLNLDDKKFAETKPTLAKAVGVAAVFGVVLILAVLVQTVKGRHPQPPPQPAAAAGAPAGVCMLEGNTMGPFSCRVSAEQVAAFLVSLGAKPSEFKVQPMKGELTGRDRIAIARNVLARPLTDPEVTPFLSWPKPFSYASPKKLDDLRRTLLLIAGNHEDVTSVPVPFRFPEFRQEDMLAFIKIVAYARERQLEEFGTTMAMGRLLFSRFTLPFEAASILLLAAIVGVLVLARGKPRREA